MPGRELVNTEKPLAFPSKSIKSCHSLSVSWSLYCWPLPIEKYSPIARLFGDYYAWLGDRYTKAIPTMEQIHELGLKAGDIEKN